VERAGIGDPAVCRWRAFDVSGMTLPVGHRLEAQSIEHERFHRFLERRPVLELADLGSSVGKSNHPARDRIPDGELDTGRKRR
jgi:hypothetical protein